MWGKENSLPFTVDNSLQCYDCCYKVSYVPWAYSFSTREWVHPTPNIRLGCNYFGGKSCSLFNYSKNDTGKSFKILVKDILLYPPGACIIKLLTAVIYGFRDKLECLPLASLSSLL